MSKNLKEKNAAKEKRREERKYKRHIRLWNAIIVIVRPFLKRIYNYEYEVIPPINGPYLVVSNHNTDLDPALVGLAFKKQMYFVASEHVYRAGIYGKLLKYVFEPIAKIKGSSDTLTVMKMIRYLRTGKNVALFPEGNRSFNGKTCEIFDATGKLVKASNASLATFKFEGGYFTTPRWGKGIRKGKLTGKLVKIYTPEELKEMTPEEITQHIREDLSENAYETQAKNPIAYKGKTPTLGFETGYCVCPKCHTIDNITSTKKQIICKNCGMETSLDDYGYFPENFDFKTVEQWDDFQEKYFADFVKENTDNKESLFFDTDVELFNFTENHEETCHGTGTFKMYIDRFVFETPSNTLELPFEDIPDMSIHGKKTLVFSATGNLHYELKAKNLINVRKYLSCFSAIKNLSQ